MGNLTMACFFGLQMKMWMAMIKSLLVKGTLILSSIHRSCMQLAMLYSVGQVCALYTVDSYYAFEALLCRFFEISIV